jgi:uncharacterized membrane protein YoaK (UPF0700 family)
MQNRSGRGGEVHSIVVKWLYGRGCGNAYRSDVPCEPSSSPHDEPAVDLRQLTTACLFAVVGGYMDAYCYLAHGQVFANTQTGNFVLFSLYASQGHWSQAVRHLPPILAGSLGVARDATSGWVLWSAGRETTANRRKAVILSLICFSFVIGTLCGSSYTRRNLAHALWPCVAVVATGFLLTYRERSRAARASMGTC